MKKKKHKFNLLSEDLIVVSHQSQCLNSGIKAPANSYQLKDNYMEAMRVSIPTPHSTDCN